MPLLTITEVIILALAVYRLTMLINEERAPFKIMERFRYAIGIRVGENNRRTALNEFAEAVLCPYCLSLWVAMGLAVLYAVLPQAALWLALPFALSGIVVALKRIGG